MASQACRLVSREAESYPSVAGWHAYDNLVLYLRMSILAVWHDGRTTARPRSSTSVNAGGALTRDPHDAILDDYSCLGERREMRNWTMNGKWSN